MKITIKKKWVTALRSGKYMKGKGKLKTAQRHFCCLGVLTDLYRKEKKITWEKAINGNEATLNTHVRSWSGLSGPLPNVIGFTGRSTNLASINDHTNVTFKEIATLIDKSL